MKTTITGREIDVLASVLLFVENKGRGHVGLTPESWSTLRQLQTKIEDINDDMFGRGVATLETDA